MAEGGVQVGALSKNHGINTWRVVTPSTVNNSHFLLRSWLSVLLYTMKVLVSINTPRGRAFSSVFLVPARVQAVGLWRMTPCGFVLAKVLEEFCLRHQGCRHLILSTVFSPCKSDGHFLQLIVNHPVTQTETMTENLIHLRLKQPGSGMFLWHVYKLVCNNTESWAGTAHSFRIPNQR